MSLKHFAEVTRHASLVFLSTLTLQATAFGVLAVSGYVLRVDDFARLSLTSAACILAVSILDLGLNLTMTKMYGDSRDEAHFRFAYAVRLLIIALATTTGIFIYAFGANSLGIGIILGSVFNLWNGVRATDQARQDYSSFVISSLSFAALRLIGSGAALWLMPNPYVIAAAVYAVPIPAIVLSRSFSLIVQAFQGLTWPSARTVFYASMVHINQVLFIAIPYAPQFLVQARLTAEDVGRYGLILTFTAPVSLVIMSVRNVLLPKMLGTANDFEDMLWSRKGALAIVGLWLALMLGGALAGWLIEAVYGHKYPETLWPFLIFYAGFTTTGMIGFMSLSMHTQNVPHYAVLTNLTKAIIFVSLLAVFGETLTAIVWITATIMVTGEIALTLALRRRRHYICELQ